MSAEAIRASPDALSAPALKLYRPTGGRAGSLWSFATAVGGWSWRMVAGPVLCFNVFLLSYLTSVVVFGWLYRWMQAVAVRGWWRHSPLSAAMSYEEFCRSLGSDAPANRPRLFVHENFRTRVLRPAGDGCRPGALLLLSRCLIGTVHSLGLNISAGLRGLAATCLLVAPGCLLMLFCWEFSWLNSFVKGYETAWMGPTTAFLGAALLAVALVYVPMAQAHQATIGTFHSFFDFRTVSRLIRARLGWYTLLAFLTFLVSLPLEALKSLPGYFDQQYPFAIRQLIEHQVSPELMRCFVTLHPGLAEASSAEVIGVLTVYFLKCAFVLFTCLLLIRWAAARIYSSAVLECLRRGSFTRADLDPKVRGYLDRMQIEIAPQPPQPWGLWRAPALAARWAVNLLLCGVLLLCWAAFAGKVYASEFHTYHPFVGFLNHPLVQFPCFDYLPPRLFWAS